MSDYTKLIQTSVMYGCYTKEQLIQMKKNLRKSPSNISSLLVGVGTGIVGLLYAGAISFVSFASGTAFSIVALSVANSNIANKLEDYIDTMNNGDFALLGLECSVTYTPRDLRDGTCSAVDILRLKKYMYLGDDPMSNSEIKDYIKIQMT